MKKNQTKNLFTMFGTPSKVIVNGVQQQSKNISDCLKGLQINSFVATYIGGILKVYVTTAQEE